VKRTLPVVTVAIVALIGAGLATGPTPAQEADPLEVTQGALRVIVESGEEPLEFPLQHTDVQAAIAGMVADVTVTQTFANPYEDTIEAVYVFPLPQNAAVNDMTMKIGDRTIRGLIKKREEAREIYEQAREAGQTAGLLEQERPNIFTQSVANITPGAEILIEIHYVQDLKYDHGTYEFTFPMVVGPRYIPGTPIGRTGGGWASDTDQVPDASRITPPVLKPGERSGHDISLSVDLNAGVPIQDLRCRSHEVEMQRTGDRRATVTLKPFDTIPNKDFMLAWDVAGEQPEMALLTHREGETGGFFSLMIQPKAEFEAGEITPRELIFVVDCSGSMSGEPIAAARQAMRRIITHMQPNDTFRVIRFSEAASQLSQEPLANTPDNIRRALVYIEQMAGSGGTQMIEGIKAALDYPADPERMRIVSFMTDGYIGNETEILAAIEEKLGGARLFSFGVGTSVNRYLLENMAEAGRGAVEYMRPNEDSSAMIDRFYERIDRPFLIDIDIDWGDLQVADIYPGRIPDLFAAQPVIVHGRYTEPGSGPISVRGRLGGELWSQRLDIDLPAQQLENAALASLWARARIKDLMDQMYQGEDEAIVAQVTNLALEFRLMSAYTAFVAVEETVVNEGGQQRVVQQPVPMPEGVSYEGVFGVEYLQNDVYDLSDRLRWIEAGQPAMLRPQAVMSAPRMLTGQGAASPAGPAGPVGGMVAGPPAVVDEAVADPGMFVRGTVTPGEAWTPGPPGPEGAGVIALSPWLCVGETEEATMAAGLLAGQQAPPISELVCLASAASRHTQVPVGMVWREAIAVADLDALPEGLKLRIVYLHGDAAVTLTAEEIAALRAFIDGGGFVFADGSRAFADSIASALHIEEWDVEIRSLPADHDLYRAEPTVYDVTDGNLRGLFAGERLAGVISASDLGSGWTAESGAELTPAWALGINVIFFLLE